MQTADVLHFYRGDHFSDAKHTHDAMSYLSSHWNSEQTNRQVGVMERHYNDIEHQGSFIGTWAKTYWRKWTAPPMPALCKAGNGPYRHRCQT
jgi:hypothetical protein